MRDGRGFTLIEVLVSTIIIGVAIIPISRAMITLIEARITSERITKTALLAKKKIEEVKLSAINNFDVNYTGSGTFPPPDDSYRYSVWDDGDPEMKTISVIVWFDENGDGKRDEDEVYTKLDTRLTRRD
ncbi:TPA: prepilin-type N-terminal cleavage/methylation domain-containing protein [Candidatus Poribacteria bacterium]|nr:prepilin-type N-terminal cleavage/methylation domain-containing protein [Candidatus Poribacteria bacterium]HEX30315.1 prepilin-type N-terminal cleavage/methylation domain-containing protein [Candidatus Poribacteria bacterium]